MHEQATREELLTPEQLTVGLPENNATLASLARDLAQTLPLHPPPAEARPRLREIVKYSPLTVTNATVVDEQEWEEGRRRTWKLELGATWTLPAVEYVPAAPDAPIALVVADGGRKESADLVADLWAKGHHVFAVDVHLTGDLVPRGMSACLWALMVSTVGERPLGTQAAHLQAAAAWAGAQVVHTRGPMTSAAAVIAAALESDSWRAELHGLPNSLQQLLELEHGFELCPTLYCFGLLREFDLPDLLALCEGRELACEET